MAWILGSLRNTIIAGFILAIGLAYHVYKHGQYAGHGFLDLHFSLVACIEWRDVDRSFVVFQFCANS